MQFSWLTVLLVLAAMAIYPFRMLCTASGKNGNKVLLKIRNLFQRLHVLFGVSAAVSACLHCQTVKQQSLQRSPLGSFLLLCLFALIVTGMSQRLLPHIWLRLHKMIAFAFFIGMLIHCFIEF